MNTDTAYDYELLRYERDPQIPDAEMQAAAATAQQCKDERKQRRQILGRINDARLVWL